MSGVSSWAKPGSSLSLGDGAEHLRKPQIPKQPLDRGGSMGHVFGHWGADTFLDWEPRFTLPPTQIVEAAPSHVEPSAKRVPRKRSRVMRVADEQ
eukprot:1429434-Amphidinium_carterae.1